MDDSYLERIEWLKKNQIDIEQYPISFAPDWMSWKLINEKPITVPGPFTSMDNYVRDAKEFLYKMVSRAGSSLAPEYLFMFATEDDQTKIPFFLLNKDEIHKSSKLFTERVDIDLPGNSFLFSLDDGMRYKIYNYQIEKRKKNFNESTRKDLVSSFISDFLPHAVSYGYFDPAPLIDGKNGGVRLVVSREVPRWYKRSFKGDIFA